MYQLRKVKTRKPQHLHANIWFFKNFAHNYQLTYRFSTCVAIRSSSNSIIPSLQSCLQLDLFWLEEVKVSGLNPHSFMCDFRLSLYQLSGTHRWRWPSANWPKNTIFGMQWSSIRATCPDQHSWAWISMASMPVIRHLLSTVCSDKFSACADVNECGSRSDSQSINQSVTLFSNI